MATKVNPWGAGMKGALGFDTNGRFIQVLIGEKQPAMKMQNTRRPDALTLSFPFGTYTVNDADKTISVRNKGSLEFYASRRRAEVDRERQRR